MLDALTPTLTGMIGSYVLVFLLPIVVVVGVGLLVLGLMKSKPAWVIGGLAFPLAVLGASVFLRAAATSHHLAPPTLEPSMNSLNSFLPYSIGIACLIFLFTALPAIVRTARR